jgi:hypothetical protein
VIADLPLEARRQHRLKAGAQVVLAGQPWSLASVQCREADRGTDGCRTRRT